jgi:hypothetical protein
VVAAVGAENEPCDAGFVDQAKLTVLLGLVSCAVTFAVTVAPGAREADETSSESMTGSEST